MDLNLQPSTQWLLVGVVIVVVSQGLVTGASALPKAPSQPNDATIQARVLKRMDTIQSHLADLTESMGDLDEEIARALRDCLGLHSELCEALELDSRLKNRQQMSESWYPGKRSSSSPQDPKVHMYTRLYDDLRRKRALLKRLTGVFQGANKVIGSERKRSCNFNLGFHCHTEEVADFADWYDYLDSPMSPGKRSGPPAASNN